MSSTSYDVSSRLVKRFCRGDSAAFDALVAHHRQRVLRLVLGMTGDRELAEEITGEVFLETYHALPKFRHESTFSTWLHRVAVNVCLEHLRRQKSRVRLTEVPLREYQGASAENPVDMAISREQAQRIAAAIESLPEAQRVTVTLFYLKQLSCAEIAEALGVPRNTVKTRLFHGTRALRDKLKGDDLLPAPGGNEGGPSGSAPSEH